MRIIRLAGTVRHVRTPAGAEFFHAPIGSPITQHEYEQLLRQRREARARYDKGHPERLKAEREVRRARKVRREQGINDDEDETPQNVTEQVPEWQQRVNEVDQRFAEKRKREAADWAKSLSTRELEYAIQESEKQHYNEEEQHAIRDELWRREDEENERKETARKKLDRDIARIEDASQYYEYYDPNYDPERNDVDKPLYHSLLSAEENARDTLYEGKRGAYGTPLPDWVPREEFDRAFVNMIYSGMDDPVHAVDNPVDIAEAARRWKAKDFGPAERELAGLTPSEKLATDHGIYDTYFAKLKEYNDGVEALQWVANAKGWSTGDVSRSLERYRRYLRAHPEGESSARQVANSVPITTALGITDAPYLESDIRDALTAQAEYAPDTVKSVQVVVTPQVAEGPGNENRHGSFTYRTGVLQVHPQVFTANNRQEVLDACRTQRWWVPGGVTDKLHHAVISHEIGHGVARIFGQQRIPQDKAFWTEFARIANVPPPPNHPMMPNDYQQWFIEEWIKLNKKRLRSRISKYGMTNVDEMLAELWAEYTQSPVPRPLAKFYGDYVVKYSKEPK